LSGLSTFNALSAAALTPGSIDYTIAGGSNDISAIVATLTCCVSFDRLAGCSDTGIGAGVGAGGGALVGSTVGHPWLGALVGGAGGAVVGHEIGKNKNND
jgi:Glycine zipper